MRCSQGFTLIEVVLALGILATTMYTLSSLQIRSLYRIIKDREQIEKVFLTKRHIYRAHLKPLSAGKKLVVKVEQPPATFVTEISELGKKSALRKFAQDLNLLKTECLWKSEFMSGQLDMISFTPKTEEEKEKQKKKGAK
ncbi:prepilin-type N-terminal cleavage/methylation domain-containing protein [Candidatus Babeliales bacterium]|nr:prepilin-type N-terminal cleavage/methylation domain-containing protein [Candidatus Babeliales bacterium]